MDSKGIRSSPVRRPAPAIAKTAANLVGQLRGVVRGLRYTDNLFEAAPRPIGGQSQNPVGAVLLTDPRGNQQVVQAKQVPAAALASLKLPPGYDGPVFVCDIDH